MLKRNLLFLFAILLPVSSYCCTCQDFKKKDIKNKIDKYEYLVLGTVIESINPDKREKIYFDSLGRSFEVKLRVDSVLAGRTGLDFIIVVQYSQDNCTRIFKLGDQYVILGDEVKKFINMTPNYKEMDDMIPITVQQPPLPNPGGLIEGKLNCYNIKNEVIDYWNNIVETETIIFTGLCSSFNMKSTYSSYFIK